MKQQAGQLFYNGHIYTVNNTFSVVNAMVVNHGKILFAGDEQLARERFYVNEAIDLQGKFVYPGFIDPHCHFWGYSTNLLQADLTGTASWNEVLQKLNSHALQHPEGWLLGRGWDQNDWPEKVFPTNKKLNELFPTRPVMLMRVDGHALLANDAALALAGVTNDAAPDGGEVITENGRLTGVLVDQAMEPVKKVIPATGEEQTIKLLQQGQARCFAVGLTSLSDAGLTVEQILLLDSLQKCGHLKMPIYAMVADEEPSKAYFREHGVYKTDRLHVCSFKYYTDGALGSHGAWLKQPYADAHTCGLRLHPDAYLKAEAEQCARYGFQMNTHAIGDAANAMVLKIYGEVLGGKNDKRWRIEHCQILDADDLPYFGRYSIIPSVQATHATSDMYWAETRLGKARMKGAYAYRALMLQNGLLANGSDFPVEDINPLYGFFAAVARRDHQGYPARGFQPENALTREEALRAMTIWAAYANFAEQEKGSLEPGKSADFVILEEDLMKAPENSLWRIRVRQTWLSGECVYACE